MTETKTKKTEEVGPVILPGYWVQLGNKAPKEYRGHLAVIESSPWAPAPIGVSGPLPGYTFDDKAEYTVLTRDEHNTLLTLDDEAFEAIGQTRASIESRG